MRQLSGQRLRRAVGAVAVAAGVAATVSACGGAPVRTPSAIGGVVFDVQWRAETPGRRDFAIRPRQLGGTAYDARHDRVVVTTASGRLQSRDARSGDVVWEVVLGFPADSVPAVVGNTVYAGFADGTVRAWRADQGQERWSFRAGTVFPSAPTIGAGMVLIQGADSRLYAIDEQTGALRWSFERPRPADLTIHGQATPTVTADSVFTGFDDGTLVRLDLEGQLVWIADLAAGAQRLGDVDTQPLLVGDTVVAGSFSGGLYGVSIEDGSIRWRHDVEGATSAVRAGDNVVTALANGQVRAFAATDGAVAWSQPLPGETPMGVIAYGSFLLVPMRAGGVLVTDANRPYLHGRFDPDSGFHALPAVDNGRFFSISDNGFVYAVGVGAL